MVRGWSANESLAFGRDIRAGMEEVPIHASVSRTWSNAQVPDCGCGFRAARAAVIRDRVGEQRPGALAIGRQIRSIPRD